MPTARSIKHPSHFIGLLLFALSCWGCGISIDIQKSESIEKMKVEREIICIDPQFYLKRTDGPVKLAKIAKYNKMLVHDISAFSKKVGLNLRVENMDLDSNAESYSKMLDLKREIVLSNFSKQSQLEFNRKAKTGEIKRSVYIYPPLISHRYNDFSSIFGTPFFSFIGIYVDNGQLYLLHLLVNTDTSETIYKELKQVKGGLNRNVVSQMVFDSVKMLKREI